MKHNLWNMISCIKNGLLAKKPYVHHRKKNICEKVLTKLWDDGFISGYANHNQTEGIIIYLKYTSNRNPCIKKIQAISKPGQRIYCSLAQLAKISSSNTYLIVSTSQGLKNLEECKRLKIGGEIILSVN